MWMEASGRKTQSASKNDTPVVIRLIVFMTKPLSKIRKMVVLRDHMCETISQLIRKLKKQIYHYSFLTLDWKTNGTSALRNHLQNACWKSPFYKKIDKNKQSTLCFNPKGLEEGSGTLASHKFIQDKCRYLLGLMCIKDNRPFSVVDDEGLRDFVWG